MMFIRKQRHAKQICFKGNKCSPDMFHKGSRNMLHKYVFEKNQIYVKQICFLRETGTLYICHIWYCYQNVLNEANIR